MLVDSLEDAWRHDIALIHAARIDQSPIAVLVTHSPARFHLAPSTRGVTRWGRSGREVIILVYNDSVRAFTRHEVMHVIQLRLWGPPGAAWVDEGLATLADGRCQGTTVLAVARGLLRADPELTASEIGARFELGAGPLLGPRLRGYVLAASMVSFVYSWGGPEAVRELRRDGIPQSATMSLEPISMQWRQYVEREAAGRPGLSSEALDARGCG